MRPGCGTEYYPELLRGHGAARLGQDDQLRAVCKHGKNEFFLPEGEETMGWQRQYRHNCGSDSSSNTVFRRLPLTLRLPSPLLALLLALTTMAILGLCRAASCHGQSSYNEAYEQSRDEFKSVQESVSTTKSTVENTKKAVDAVEAQIRLKIQQLRKANQPIPDNLKNAAAKFKNARMALKRSHDVLANFGDYSDKITAVTDVYDEINELRTKMEADRQAMGDLAAELRALGALMEKGGEYVPILGDAIKAYGAVTTGLVDKLGEVATTIDGNRNQDQIGHGTHDTNEKNRIFREFQRSHPELVADVYHRSVPAYLYEPVGTREGNSVLWDEATQQFYIVPADVPAKDIFKMSLLVEKRLSPPDLMVLMGHWQETGAPNLETARAMQPMLNSLRQGPFADVVSRVSREGDGLLFRLLQNPRLFEAMYVYGGTRDELHRDLKAIHDGLIAEGALDQAAAIRDFSKSHRLAIAFTVPGPVVPPKPEKKTAEKKKPAAAGQKTATPPPEKQKKAAKEKPAAKPAAAKPKVKAGSVVGSCSACADSGLDCACGKAACRCCAPGDSDCNAFDL